MRSWFILASQPLMLPTPWVVLPIDWPITRVPPWKLSRFLAGNREAVLIPTTFFFTSTFSVSQSARYSRSSQTFSNSLSTWILRPRPLHRLIGLKRYLSLIYASAIYGCPFFRNHGPCGPPDVPPALMSIASPNILPLHSSRGTSPTPDPSAAFPKDIPDLQDIQFSQEDLVAFIRQIWERVRLRSLPPFALLRPPCFHSPPPQIRLSLAASPAQFLPQPSSRWSDPSSFSLFHIRSTHILSTPSCRAPFPLLAPHPSSFCNQSLTEPIHHFRIQSPLFINHFHPVTTFYYYSKLRLIIIIFNNFKIFKINLPKTSLFSNNKNNNNKENYDKSSLIKKKMI